MDLSKLSMPHRIAAGGGIVLLVASFMPWYSVGALGVRFSINGWDAGFPAWFGILMGVAAAAVLTLKALEITDLHGGGLAAEQISFLLALVSAIFVVLRLVTESSAISFGYFLGLISVAAVAYGTFQAMKAAGLHLSADTFRHGPAPH